MLRLKLNHLSGELLNLLFPSLCNACGILLYKGEDLICTRCLYDLPYTDFHSYTDNPVAKQFWGRVSLNAAMALFYFGKGSKVQKLIHNLKYKDQTLLGNKLGNMLGVLLLSAPAYKDISLIVPVPLHKKRERQRGYNQSKCIAEGIAEIINAPLAHQLLTRVVETSSQTKKGRYKRFENMKTVFKVKEEFDLKHHHILLVDDVMTTGATLEACCIELLKLQPLKLSIATIAFAK